MSRIETLKRLEQTLESFLERAVFVKAERIRVLGGINRLDDIARKAVDGGDPTDSIGQWFAEHNRLRDTGAFTPAEQHRISDLLGEIRRELRVNEQSSPAINKIASEIERWRQTPTSTGVKLVLKRGPEVAEPTGEEPTIAKFHSTLDKISALFADKSATKKHLLSVLDDSLKSATLQKSPDALILSGLLVYYLKLNGYKVDPFVKRLKEAEQIQKQDGVRHAE